MSYKMTRLQPFGLIVKALNPKTKASELEVEDLRSFFREHQLVVLRGFSSFQNAEDFSNYCELWGEVSLWPFGKVLELVEQETPQDHIFDNKYVPLHWDGMYRPQVPEYQIFHCVRAPLPGEGGKTTFSNTILALESASPEIKELWNKITGTYQRSMEFYNSKTMSPIITQHPHRNVSVIRYNEPPAKEKVLLNPPTLTFRGLKENDLEVALKSLQQALYSPNNFYAHEWQTGDIVIADNFSLLHGREEFISKSPRHIQRVHVLSNPPFNNPGLEYYQ